MIVERAREACRLGVEILEERKRRDAAASADGGGHRPGHRTSGSTPCGSTGWDEVLAGNLTTMKQAYTLLRDYAGGRALDRHVIKPEFVPKLIEATRVAIEQAGVRVNLLANECANIVLPAVDNLDRTQAQNVVLGYQEVLTRNYKELETVAPAITDLVGLQSALYLLAVSQE